MKTLNELFNSKIKYKMGSDSAKFVIDDIEYMVDWTPNGGTGPDNDWEIGFGSRDVGSNGRWALYVTDDGNEFKVFATVMNIIKDFIKKKKPYGISFTAKEKNRRELYRKMTKRFKKWDTSEHMFGMSLEFYMTRKD